MKLSSVLRSAEGGRLVFMCPGCDSAHVIPVGDGPGPRWSWNGDAERPTFSPSVMNTWKDVDNAPRCCHLFVRDGQIDYLTDCTHALAGQRVPLPPFRHEDWE